MKFFKSLKNQATGFLDQYKQKDPASYSAAQQAVGGLLILDGFIGIDNPFDKKNRQGIFGTLWAMAFAVIFMVVPTIVGNVTGMNKMTAQTNGQVVSVGAPRTSTDSDGNTTTTCNFTAKYTVDGKQYQSPSSSSSSSSCQMTPGQTVNIDYNPQNPAQWMSDKQFVSTILNVFFFAGLFFFLSSLVTFIIRLISIIFGWKILRSGRKLAKSLPNGPDMTTMINTIKADFTKVVFGFNNVTASPVVTVPSAVPVSQVVPATAPLAPVPVAAPVSIVQPAPQPVATQPPVNPTILK